MKKNIFFTITILLLTCASVSFGALREAGKNWTMTYKGPAHNEDIPVAIASDKDGNTIVLASSGGDKTGIDYAIIKYDPSGQQLWASRYNGENNGDDTPISLALDDEGNCYVTGTSANTNGLDILTIKYSASGNQLWFERYDGVGKNDDLAHSIVVTQSGNVVIGGSSISKDGQFDFLIVSYNSAGKELWSKNYDGGFKESDMITGIGFDDQDNIVVTGTSQDNEGKTACATIKYTIDGKQLWVDRSTDGNAVNTTPCGIVIDKSGNAIVAGYCSYEEQDRYYIRKISKDGNVLWNNSFGESVINLPVGIKSDDFGNLYVVGASNSSGSEASATIYSFNTKGIARWQKFYERLEPQSFVIDATGGVYVTGRANPITSINNGEVNVDMEHAVSTVRFTRSGDLALVVKADRSINFEPRVITVDQNANVIVGGAEINTEGIGDVAVTKYSSGVLMDQEKSLPTEFKLNQNYPNPFNPVTTISFSLPEPSIVTLTITNTLGQEVFSLANHTQFGDGFHELTFDASTLSSGVYFYRIDAQSLTNNEGNSLGKSFTDVKKMLLMK